MIGNRRTHEIGIRLALGAAHEGVRRLVMAGSLTMVAIGLVIGGMRSLWLGRSPCLVNKALRDDPKY